MSIVQNSNVSFVKIVLRGKCNNHRSLLVLSQSNTFCRKCSVALTVLVLVLAVGCLIHHHNTAIHPRHNPSTTTISITAPLDDISVAFTIPLLNICSGNEHWTFATKVLIQPSKWMCLAGAVNLLFIVEYPYCSMLLHEIFRTQWPNLRIVNSSVEISSFALASDNSTKQG